jgi:hypothetical protein
MLISNWLEAPSSFYAAVSSSVNNRLSIQGGQTKPVLDLVGHQTNPTFNFARSRGTMAAPTAVASGDSLLTMQGFGYDGTTWTNGATWLALVDGTVSSGVVPGRFEFRLNNSAGTQITTNVMHATEFDINVNTLVTQPVQTSGSPRALQIIGGAHTTLATGAEALDVYFNIGRTVQFATGAITTQRAVYIEQPTYGFVAASTITKAATFAVQGAPVAGTNATLTNSYAFWVQAGLTQLDGALTMSTGALNLLANAASTIQTTSANLTIQTVTSGVLALTSAGLMQLDTSSASGLAILTDVTHRLNFFNQLGAVAQQTVTGSRATGAALVSLLTALANYGLIVDSSTA